MSIVELCQNRALVNTKFDGYKLSLEPIPILRQTLSSAPLKYEAGAEQYSLFHAEIFSLHNLLQADPWARTDTYFVNSQREIICSCYDVNSGRGKPLIAVYRLESEELARRAGDYNYTLRFISENLCVLCDGIMQLQLLHTGDRLKQGNWKLLASARLDATGGRGFVLYDARLDTIQERKQISLALGHVARTEHESGIGQHFMRIHWAQWHQRADSWHFQLCEQIEGKGSIYYCAFEPRGESLVMSSNRELLMQAQREARLAKRAETSTSGETSQPQLDPAEPTAEFQSENIPSLPMYEELPVNGAASGADTANEEYRYSWTQDNEDVVVRFAMLPAESTRSSCKVDSTKQTICVKVLQDTLLDGTLHAEVDNELTTYTFKDRQLQITLVKAQTALNWPSLLQAGQGPKELKSESGGVTLGDGQPILNLETPIEDCDMPIDDLGNDNEVFLERFNLTAKQATHTVLLGTNPPLFSTTLRAGFPAALVTRQDVDASLWLQHYYPSKPNEWTMRHDGNLHAFGYVQASKQQKKFIDCAPDLSYAIICETHRHIFLYKANYESASGLRNRHGPQMTIGKQHLITLADTDGEVLGLCTAAGVVTVLTAGSMLYLQIQ